MSSSHSKCKICGEQHRLGAEYCPALNSSGGGVESRHATVGQRATANAPHAVRLAKSEVPKARMGEKSAGVAPSPPGAKAIVRKATPAEEKMFKPIVDIFENAKRRGRPLAKDADKTLAKAKPWETEGVSRRTWFRRQKEAKE